MRRHYMLWENPEGKLYFAITQGNYVHFGSGYISAGCSPLEKIRLLATGVGKSLYSREGWGPEYQLMLEGFIDKRSRDTLILDTEV